MGRKLTSGSSVNLNLGSIVVSGDTITPSSANTNLVLDANGTGIVTTPDIFAITNTTQSTATNNGAVIITGGVGITGDLYYSGSLNNNTLNNTAIGSTLAAAGNFSTLTATGLTTVSEVVEVMASKTGATGTVTHDFTETNIWYHSSISANFTVNLTNVPTTNDRVINIHLILSQGATPRYVSGFQIDGVAQTIRWANYYPPTPSASALEVQTFTLIRSSSSWTVLSSFQSSGALLNGSSALLAAPSAEYLASIGLTGKGYYYINTPNGGIRQVWCDLDTADQFGGKGWMLVASWTNGSNWTLSTNSTNGLVNPGPTPGNAWSSNFGDQAINFFRVTANSNVNTTLGSSATADWYYYYGTSSGGAPITWKEVWAWNDGNFNYSNYASGTANGGDDRGNLAAFSGWPTPVNAGTTIERMCLRPMNWAYNLKYGYQVNQRHNNLSDGGGTSYINCNFWNGLRNTGVALNWNLASDGTLAILPQGDTSTTAAHDCNTNNCKVGYDDAGVCYYYGASATANMGANVANTGSDVSLYFWIK